MTNRTPADRHRTLRLLGALAGLSSCWVRAQIPAEKSLTGKYSERFTASVIHRNSGAGPLDSSFFVGHARGGLSASQRADVMGLARTWVREEPVRLWPMFGRHANARAAADSFREVQALLAAGGVPPRGITLRRYHSDDPRTFATIRLSYPRMAAVAGPCGLWPEDSDLDREPRLR